MRKVLFCTWKYEDYEIIYSEMDKEGLFHQFITVDEEAFALIENLEGFMIAVRIDKFKFVDSPEDEMWKQRRYEIAKELFANTKSTFAVMYADELIEILKK